MDAKKNLYAELSIGVVLISVIVAARFWIETPNYQPVLAIALCGGLFFRRSWLTVCVPLLGMLISDYLFEGIYSWPLMLTVYVAMAAPTLAGRLIRKQSPQGRWGRRLAVIAGLLGSAFFFYLATNLVVWAGGIHYARDFSGLGQCYLAAIPFFKWTVSSTLLYGCGLFFAWEWMSHRSGFSPLIPVAGHSRQAVQPAVVRK